jgi:hypothetical protein
MAEDKGTGTTDKGAAAGGAPVSDKKAADTSEAYQKAAGLESEPASDSDPVIDSMNAAVEGLDLEDREPVTGPINPDFEAEKEEAFENRETDDGDEDPDRTEKKSAAKKTAAKKS